MSTAPEQPIPAPQVAPSPVAVAVSTVIFSLRPTAAGHDVLWLPLVRRTRAPHLGAWALPGGWVKEDESLEAAAARTLDATTGLSARYLEQLYTFGRPDRSDDGRVISVVYNALLRNRNFNPDTANVAWFPADELPSLAFDHRHIVDYALWRLRTKIEYADVAHLMLDETFTMRQLREVYEAILQKRLDPANFRRRAEASGVIVPTGQRAIGGQHRPPLLYRCSTELPIPIRGPRS